VHIPLEGIADLFDQALRERAIEAQKYVFLVVGLAQLIKICVIHAGS